MEGLDEAGRQGGRRFAADLHIEAGTPESFNVLIKEMQGLGLDVKVGGKDPFALTDTAAA